MYKIAKERFGLQVTFAGEIQAEELMRWLEDSKTLFAGLTRRFSILVDMRGARPANLQPDALAVLVEGQRLYRAAGMERSCVIVESGAAAMPCKRLARESGIHTSERYIDASLHSDWYAKALGWVENRIDPDSF